MFPTTPPATHLSRSRLKALSKWIRDELDLLVAREGSNVLQPDDVLILHETFITLRLATDITALDLRATGIHLAVQDIAGVATRWPSRLCDDCDKILSIWTVRFGSLKNLHPFLYGRGGRLEGIASATECSREALLKRWSEQCPERLHPKRSHRLGNLGFQAGDWWINTLFAHHAGIIGLEAVEGGTTFDKYGAYALVLKDTGEVQACEDNFTYRVPQADKGKYRLTAATPRSRDPIRVLRCHSINSIWGPKAGVRYEGLFSVKGWSIRQAKTADTAGGEWKEGDVVFEVHFVRTDRIPFSEVINRPTATEADDYAEYKRLRKLHREGKYRAGLEIDPSITNPLHQIKAAPPILPASQPTALRIAHRGSPRQTNIFKPPQFDLTEEWQRQEPNATEPESFNEAGTDYITPTSPGKGSTLAVPGHATYRPSTFSRGSSSSKPTQPGTRSNIREVAPWIDFDVELKVPDASQPQSAPAQDEALELKAAQTARTVLNQMTTKGKTVKESPQLSAMSQKRQSGDFKAFLSPSRAGSKHNHSESSHKSIVARTKNPMAKLFDGAGSTSTEDEECPHRHQSTRSGRYKPVSSSCSDPTTKILSPLPTRPFHPDPRFTMAPHGTVHTTTNGTYQDVTASLESLHDDQVAPPTSPGFLLRLISQPTCAAALATAPTTPSGARICTPESVTQAVGGMCRETRVVFKMPDWGGVEKGEGEER